MLFNFGDWENIFILGIYLLQLGKKHNLLALGMILKTGVGLIGGKITDTLVS